MLKCRQIATRCNRTRPSISRFNVVDTEKADDELILSSVRLLGLGGRKANPSF